MVYIQWTQRKHLPACILHTAALNTDSDSCDSGGEATPHENQQLEGGIYSIYSFWLCGYYSRVASTIQSTTTRVCEQNEANTAASSESKLTTSLITDHPATRKWTLILFSYMYI